VKRVECHPIQQPKQRRDTGAIADEDQDFQGRADTNNRGAKAGRF
jgi:hypothetical protein